MIVYSLTDPIDNIVRYIGISKHTAEKRFATHLKDSKTKRRKGQYLSIKEKWILDLFDKGLKPIIQTIHTNLTVDEALKIEQDLIEQHKRKYENGTLFNVQSGGFYDSCKAQVWNKGVHGYMSEEMRINNKINQPNKKEVYRFNKQGELIDTWHSIRDMCHTLNLDRRTVMRCLKREENFVSHKGFMFSHTITPPVYFNKSTTLTYHNSPHAKAIIAIKDGKELHFLSIKEAGETLNIPSASISAVLRNQQYQTRGYIFKYK